MTHLQLRQKQLVFAIYFRRFMLANNKFKFSSYEILAIASEINKELKLNLGPIQAILILLSSYGITNIVSKYSKSTRHLYWFTTPLCLKTFKVTNNV